MKNTNKLKRPYGGMDRINAENKDSSVKTKSLSIVLKPAMREWLDYLATLSDVPAGVFLKQLLQRAIEIYLDENKMYSEDVFVSREFVNLINHIFQLIQNGKVDYEFSEDQEEIKLGYSQIIGVFLESIYFLKGEKESGIGFLVIEGIKQYTRLFQLVVFDKSISGESELWTLTLRADQENPETASVVYSHSMGEKSEEIPAEEFFIHAESLLKKI